MKFVYQCQGMDETTQEVEVVPHPEREGYYRVTVQGQEFTLSPALFTRVAWLQDAGRITLQYAGREYHLVDATQRRPTAPQRSGDLRAPMAGKVLRVLVRPGDQVKAGDPLLILEAMKMEQQITAPRDGVIARLLCRPGDQVATGAELVVLEDLPPTHPVPASTPADHG